MSAGGTLFLVPPESSAREVSTAVVVLLGLARLGRLR